MTTELAKQAIDKAFCGGLQEAFEVLVGHVEDGTVEEGKARFRQAFNDLSEAHTVAMEVLQ